jgi:hypothetical protein
MYYLTPKFSTTNDVTESTNPLLAPIAIFILYLAGVLVYAFSLAVKVWNEKEDAQGENSGPNSSK